MPFEIPENWCFTHLKTVCWLEDGEKVNEELINLDAKYLRGKSTGEIKSSGRKIKQNERMILVDGENSGEVFTAPHDGFLGSTFKKMNFANTNFIEYINIFLSLHKEEFKNNKTGSAIPHLNKKLFAEMLIPVPPLSEQIRISNKVKQIFDTLDSIQNELV